MSLGDDIQAFPTNVDTVQVSERPGTVNHVTNVYEGSPAVDQLRSEVIPEVERLTSRIEAAHADLKGKSQGHEAVTQDLYRKIFDLQDKHSTLHTNYAREIEETKLQGLEQFVEIRDFQDTKDIVYMLRSTLNNTIKENDDRLQTLQELSRTIQTLDLKFQEHIEAQRLKDKKDDMCEMHPKLNNVLQKANERINVMINLEKSVSDKQNMTEDLHSEHRSEVKDTFYKQQNDIDDLQNHTAELTKELSEVRESLSMENAIEESRRHCEKLVDVTLSRIDNLEENDKARSKKEEVSLHRKFVRLARRFGNLNVEQGEMDQLEQQYADHMRNMISQKDSIDRIERGLNQYLESFPELFRNELNSMVTSVQHALRAQNKIQVQGLVQKEMEPLLQTSTQEVKEELFRQAESSLQRVSVVLNEPKTTLEEVKGGLEAFFAHYKGTSEIVSQLEGLVTRKFDEVISKLNSKSQPAQSSDLESEAFQHSDVASVLRAIEKQLLDLQNLPIQLQDIQNPLHTIDVRVETVEHYLRRQDESTAGKMDTEHRLQQIYDKVLQIELTLNQFTDAAENRDKVMQDVPIPVASSSRSISPSCSHESLYERPLSSRVSNDNLSFQLGPSICLDESFSADSSHSSTHSNRRQGRGKRRKSSLDDEQRPRSRIRLGTRSKSHPSTDNVQLTGNEVDDSDDGSNFGGVDEGNDFHNDSQSDISHRSVVRRESVDVIIMPPTPRRPCPGLVSCSFRGCTEMTNLAFEGLQLGCRWFCAFHGVRNGTRSRFRNL